MTILQDGDNKKLPTFFSNFSPRKIVRKQSLRIPVFQQSMSCLPSSVLCVRLSLENHCFKKASSMKAVTKKWVWGLKVTS